MKLFGTRTKDNLNDLAAAEEGGSGLGNKKKKTMRQLDEIPARRCFHKFFIFVSVIVVLCAVWMAAGQVLGAIIYKNSLVQYVLRGYVIILAVLVILIEIEWPKSIRETPLFYYWIPRGLVYLFVGVIGMQENDKSEFLNSDEENEFYNTISDILVAVAWNMAGCGALYFVMGILCLQLILNDLREDYQARFELAKTRLRESDSGSNHMDKEKNTEDDTEQAAIQAAQSAFAGESPCLDWADKSGSTTKKSLEEGEGHEAESWVKEESKDGEEHANSEEWNGEISREVDDGASEKQQEGWEVEEQSNSLTSSPSNEHDSGAPVAQNTSTGSDDDVSVQGMASE